MLNCIMEIFCFPANAFLLEWNVMYLAKWRRILWQIGLEQRNGTSFHNICFTLKSSFLSLDAQSYCRWDSSCPSNNTTAFQHCCSQCHLVHFSATATSHQWLINHFVINHCDPTTAVSSQWAHKLTETLSISPEEYLYLILINFVLCMWFQFLQSCRSVRDMFCCLHSQWSKLHSHTPVSLN